MPSYAGDTLLYRDRVFRLGERPLEAWFGLIGYRPDLRRPMVSPAEAPDHAASWEIGNDGLLRLVGLTGNWPDGNPLALAHLFPMAEEPVVATWFTGMLHGIRIGPVGQALVAAQQTPHWRAFPRDGIAGPAFAELLLDIRCGQLLAAGEPMRAAAQVVEDSPRWATALV